MWTRSPLLLFMVLGVPYGVAQDAGHGTKKVVVDTKHSGSSSGIKDTSDAVIQKWFYTNADNIDKKGYVSSQAEVTAGQQMRYVGQIFTDLPFDQKQVYKKLFISDNIVVTDKGVTGTKDLAGSSLFQQTLVDQNVKISDTTTQVAKDKTGLFKSPQDNEAAKALIISAVALAMNSPQAQTGSGDGVLPPISQDGAFDSTRDSVSSAGSGGGSPRSRDSIKVDTSGFASRAREVLGLGGRGGFDIVQNPFLSAGADPAVRSAFQNIALNTLNNDSDGSKDLLGLAGTKGFQDTLRNTLGEDGQKDFNLLTAGATVAANPDISKDGLELAQNFVNSGLSSNQLIQASPALSSLSQSLGGSGLSGLSVGTLEWLLLASRLRFDVDAQKLPLEFREKRDTYIKGYAGLEELLKGLKGSSAVNLLEEIRVPYEPDRAEYGWKIALEKFQMAHREALRGRKVSTKGVESSNERFAPAMKRLITWTSGIQKQDAKKLAQWRSMLNAQGSELGRLWKKFQPTSLDSAQLNASRAEFFASLPRFYADSKDPVAILIQDAQTWATNLEKERQSSRKSRLAKQGLDGDLSKAKRAPANFMKE